MHRRRRAMRLLPIALMALFAPLSLAAQEVALDVTASEMAQPIDAARMLPGATPAAFPLPRPTTLRSATAAPEISLRPVERDPWAAPRLRWDGHSQDMDWTLATMAALRGPGASLARTVPRDIADWCPGYEAAGTGQRRAFWAGLVSALAWHESTHRGRGGRRRALVRAGADLAGDGALSGLPGDLGRGAPGRGPANLRCGLRIMGATVPRDGVVSRGMRGVAADWGPFHSTRKREDMRQWLRAQDYCRARARGPARPIMRPVTG
jgi:hypothetical protein